jgi:hypothetical protein
MEPLNAFDDAISNPKERATIKNLLNFMSAHFLTFRDVYAQQERQEQLM